MAQPARVLDFKEKASTSMDQWLKESECDTRCVSVKMEYIKLLDGDFDAAGVLSQAVYLQEHAACSDGWFPKSATEWERDLGFSKFQMQGIIKKLQAYGLKVEVRGVRPSPTWHFQVDLDVLKKAIIDHRQQVRNSPIRQQVRKSNIKETHLLTDEKLTSQQVRNSPIVLEEDKLDHVDHPETSVSGNAAVADVPSVRPRSRKKSAATTSRQPPVDIPPEYRGELLGLVRNFYNDVPQENKQLGAVRQLYMMHPRASPEEVTECWTATLVDPYWDTATIDLTTMVQKLPTYRRNPEGYRKAMQIKRDKANSMQQRGANGNGQRHQAAQRGGTARDSEVSATQSERAAERAGYYQ